MRADQKRTDREQDRCSFCLDSPNLDKHLIIAAGVKTYLALPARGSLARGHCLIVPSAHVASTLLADEDVWTEMRVRKRCEQCCDNTAPLILAAHAARPALACSRRHAEL